MPLPEPSRAPVSGLRPIPVSMRPSASAATGLLLPEGGVTGSTSDDPTTVELPSLRVMTPYPGGGISLLRPARPARPAQPSAGAVC